MRTTSKSKKSAVCSLPPPPRLRRTCRSAFSPLASVLRPPTSRPRAAAGFTLLELLIVIALIMVLAGLMIPAFSKVQNKAKEKKAQIEAKIIGSAIRSYKLQEKKFPAPPAHLAAGVDTQYGHGASDDNRLVVGLFTNSVPSVLDAGKLRWDQSGNVINPWDNQYRITLDLDYDGKVDGDYAEYKVEWDFQ